LLAGGTHVFEANGVRHSIEKDGFKRMPGSVVHEAWLSPGSETLKLRRAAGLRIGCMAVHPKTTSISRRLRGRFSMRWPICPNTAPKKGCRRHPREAAIGKSRAGQRRGPPRPIRALSPS
jgi:hypothetical protein